MERSTGEFGDGHAHGLEPLEPLDIDSITSFSDLASQMARTAFAGRALGEAVDVVCEMSRDAACYSVLTLSGAMTVAKQGEVISRLIEHGGFNAVVSTGAIICHGLSEGMGHTHFKIQRGVNDSVRYRRGYNRIYDTVELESSLDEVEAFVFKVLARRDVGRPLSSHEFCRALGKELIDSGKPRGLLQAAFRCGIPVFIPAFTDSELGLDMMIFNSTREPAEAVRFEPLADMVAYFDAVGRAESLGILVVGGGVPRNWAQQVGPYFDALSRRGGAHGGKAPQFKYGVRICPEPVHWGGLSGCTFEEGVSWGKFVPRDQGGRFAEVYCDATIALPILTLAALERLGVRSRPP